jgi:hypothetical protein
MMQTKLRVIAGLILATPLTAQQPPDTALAARLERAERQIELLRQQLAALAASRVEPRSGNRVELSGRVLVNAFFNNAKVNNSDVPAVVLPPDPPNFPASAAGATVRQSQVALTAVVPDLAGGSFAGELDVDFFGGQQPSPGGRTFPLVRIRRVRAEITWPHAWVMFGQEAPPIAEINPSSLSQIGTPSFANSGNLWLWIPQVRLGAETGGAVRVGLEASALAPTAAEPQTAFTTQPDRAERSRRPAAEGRLRVRWDAGQTAGELSVGGHLGWLALSVDSLVATRAAAASLVLTATRYFELRAEGFMGRVLAGLGGGGIGQNFGAGSVPVRSKGGWAQLNFKPIPQFELGGGYGFDNPDDADLNLVLARLKNVAWEGHVHWRPRPLAFGAEFRRIETTYATPFDRLWVNHVNVAAGFEF